MIQASAGQSLLDIVIQEMGCVDGLFELAATNGLTITDDLVPGQLLMVPASDTADVELVKLLKSRNVRINTDNYLLAPAPEEDELNDFSPNDFLETDFH
ncbi:hypothetical protein [Hymenobacter sp. CRA2]|uniref:hypothetical protein n=1 Tax=Hymenobacter sp. CRA2 TaxID=1955620 RepID=UPI00098ED4C8|nr:hypothetical protein [Hymenobacter sp. CRA2]OON67806.1 hypothetical protein B0919_16610 [Hymenobacter sp. CRA2]